MYILNSFNSKLSRIDIGIGRLDISIPALLYMELIQRMYKDGVLYKTYPDGKYSVVESCILGTVVQVRKFKLKSCQYERVYIRILNPDHNIQIYFKEMLKAIFNRYFIPVSKITIKQVEVKYDHYCSLTDVTELKKDTVRLKRLFDRHLVHKYSRAGSHVKVKTTWYFGNNGIVHDGVYGTRSYIKDNKYFPDTTFFRAEFQYNAEYFHSKKITINDLPFNPLSFESFKRVDFLDCISRDGLKSVAKAILKTEGVKITDKLFRLKLRDKTAELTPLIYQTANHKPKNVHEQISIIKELKSKHDFEMNHKNHFAPLNGIKELILCHADVSYDEVGVSKRMVLCNS